MATAAPTLPIKNRSTVTETGARTPKRGGATGRGKPREEQPKQKAWADFTPTPWLDYAPTPWSAHGSVPAPYGSMFMGPMASSGKEGRKEAHMAEMLGAYPSTPTPKSWGATPTPSGAPGMLHSFGLAPPMLGGMPMMALPGFAAMAQMAEAAAAAAGAAAAAAAASMNSSAEPSPTHGAQDEEGGLEMSYRGDAYDASTWSMQPGMVPLSVQAVPQNASSKGSALHGTGKCRPCAWFWKPLGCNSAEECTYCHLCPEGELKSRKKLKVAAMRMGALTPAKPGTAPGAARTLKLTSLV